MGLLNKLKEILDDLEIPNSTTVYGAKAPDEFVVMTPLHDNFALFADNRPQAEVQEVRMELFTKSNYNKFKNKIINKLLADDGIVIMTKGYVDRENDTGYYHYTIDVAEAYETEETYGNNRT